MNFRKVVMAVVLSSLIVAVIFVIFLAATGKGEFAYEYGNVKTFFICSGPDLISGKPGENIKDLSTSYGYHQEISMQYDADRFFACGYVSTHGKPSKFGIYVRDRGGKLIFATPEQIGFGPGYFYYKISPLKRLSTGTYSIELIKGRQLIKSIELVVTEP